MIGEDRERSINVRGNTKQDRIRWAGLFVTGSDLIPSGFRILRSCKCVVERRITERERETQKERDFVEPSEFRIYRRWRAEASQSLILYPLFWLVITQNTIMMLKSKNPRPKKLSFSGFSHLTKFNLLVAIYYLAGIVKYPDSPSPTHQS